MSENEIKDELEVPVEEPEQETPEQDEIHEEAEEKPKLTPEQIKGIKLRQLKKLQRELGISEKPEEKPESAPQNKSTISEEYAKLALLKAHGIESSELDLVEELLDETGKPLPKLLESNYFKAALEEHRQKEATKKATPKGAKPSSTPASENVEYWVDKKGLPTDPELKRKVVRERLKRASGPSGFTPLKN